MNKSNREIAKVLVTFKKVVTLDLIEVLTLPEMINDGTIPRRSYAVMVPTNADVSELPKDLNVMFMKSFAFDGKELVWIKKPVRKTENDVKKSPANS